MSTRAFPRQEYTEENLVDPKIVELARKIRIELDPEIEDEWQKTRPRGARVTVRLKSGKTYTECVHNLRSMSAADVVDKVRRLANVALDAEQSERLITAVQNLEALQDLSTLVPLLVREHSLT